MAKVEEGGKVDRALTASPGLDELIVRSLQVAYDGRIWFQPDLTRLARITTKLAFGLHALRYGRGRGLDRFETTWIGGPGEEPPYNLVTAQWRWPGIRRKRWTVVQAGVFSFLFARGWLSGDPPLFCLLDFHRTIYAAVSGPAPVGRRAHGRRRILGGVAERSNATDCKSGEIKVLQTGSAKSLARQARSQPGFCARRERLGQR